MYIFFWGGQRQNKWEGIFWLHYNNYNIEPNLSNSHLKYLKIGSMALLVLISKQNVLTSWKRC